MHAPGALRTVDDETPRRHAPRRTHGRPMTLQGPWAGYDSPGCWDEMVSNGQPHPACVGVMSYLSHLGDELLQRQEAAELAIRSMGISFTVYSERGNIDRAWPFDVRQ